MALRCALNQRLNAHCTWKRIYERAVFNLGGHIKAEHVFILSKCFKMFQGTSSFDNIIRPFQWAFYHSKTVICQNRINQPQRFTQHYLVALASVQRTVEGLVLHPSTPFEAQFPPDQTLSTLPFSSKISQLSQLLCTLFTTNESI